MNIIVLVIISVFAWVLFIAVWKSRRANTEQSAADMHPSNFERPTIERVEKAQPDKKE